MRKERKIKPVSFNATDVYEVELYEFAISQQKYFSRYVKRLIEQDRSRQETVQEAELYKERENRQESVGRTGIIGPNGEGYKKRRYGKNEEETRYRGEREGEVDESDGIRASMSSFV